MLAIKLCDEVKDCCFNYKSRPDASSCVCVCFFHGHQSVTESLSHIHIAQLGRIVDLCVEDIKVCVLSSDISVSRDQIVE